MPPTRSLGSTTWNWSRCWTPSGASRLLHEPPDAEPHVRWCGRTARVTSPPTRCSRQSAMESAKKVSVFRVNGVQTDHAIITVELFFLADVEPNIRIIDRSVFGTPLSRIKWSPLSLREGLVP